MSRRPGAPRVHRLGHLGLGVADVDLPAGDVVRSAVERRRSRQPGDGVLRRRVGRRPRARHAGRDRAVVDDPPALRCLALHQPESFLRAEKRPGEVRLDHGHPVVEREIFEQDGRGADAGVVEEEIESAEAIARPC